MHGNSYEKGKMRRTRSTRRLEIKDVEVPAVKAMLQYMYTGVVNVDTKALASVLSRHE